MKISYFFGSDLQTKIFLLFFLSSFIVIHSFNAFCNDTFSVSVLFPIYLPVLFNKGLTEFLVAGLMQVLRALRRLKGSSDKKHKISAETKQLFDQLSEDAMKLMENGDYNVYEEKQEHFKREAGLQ